MIVQKKIEENMTGQYWKLVLFSQKYSVTKLWEFQRFDDTNLANNCSL